jgi:hypothetical protein
MARMEQLQDNLAAADLELIADEMKQLDEVSALPRDYPGWILAQLGADRSAPMPRPVWEYVPQSASN